MVLGYFTMVAPFTGAWIETKQEEIEVLNLPWSHPSRVRGLKRLRKAQDIGIPRVAPFTGAWIETPEAFPSGWKGRVAPFTGAWIETSKIMHFGIGSISRTLHGCVD